MTHKRIHKPREADSGCVALTNDQAAAYIGAAKNSLKSSRRTGLLWGMPAPEFKKAARKVIYLRATLDKWVDQLPTYQSTAQSQCREAR